MALTNLEKIKAAAEMGWSAIIEVEGKTKVHSGPVLEIADDYKTILIKDVGRYTFNEISEYYVKITGYIYAGQLLGSGKIPEGQRFRVKGSESANIIFLGGKFKGVPKEGAVLKPIKDIDNEKIEPVFD